MAAPSPAEIPNVAAEPGTGGRIEQPGSTSTNATGAAVKETSPLLSAEGAGMAGVPGNSGSSNSRGGGSGSGSGSGGGRGEPVAGIPAAIVLASLYVFAGVLTNFFFTIASAILVDMKFAVPYNAGYAYYAMGYIASMAGVPAVYLVSLKSSGQFTCHPGDYTWIMLARLIYWVLYVVTVGYGGYFMFSAASSGCINVPNCGGSTSDILKVMIANAVATLLAIWDACFTGRYHGRDL